MPFLHEGIKILILIAEGTNKGINVFQIFSLIIVIAFLGTVLEI